MSFRDQIIARVDKAKDLPTLPTVFTKLREQLDSPTSSSDDVAGILREDIALSTKVLKVANSAAFAAAEEITSVSFAISRMGFKTTADIAMSLSVLNLFSSGTGRIDYPAFWKHSLCVAAAMPLVAINSGKAADNPQITFTAGLMHDIGIFILDQYGGDLYNAVLSMAADSQTPLHEAEKRLMGIDHAEIGGHVMAKWNLPEKIVNGVKNHHLPPEPNKRELTASELIYASNEICKSMDISNGFDTTPVDSSDQPDWWEPFGIDQDKVDAVKKSILAQAEKSSVLLAISKE